MNRRGFLALIGLAPTIAMARVEDASKAFVPLPDGRRIPCKILGGSDAETAALIDAKITASNAQMIADLQKNIGSMTAKWDQRNGH